VRLALDPEGPNGFARGHTSNLTILDWYYTWGLAVRVVMFNLRCQEAVPCDHTHGFRHV